MVHATVLEMVCMPSCGPAPAVQSCGGPTRCVHGARGNRKRGEGERGRMEVKTEVCLQHNHKPHAHAFERRGNPDRVQKKSIS